MKYIYLLLFLFVFTFVSLEADYWEEVTDISPSEFVNSYWLDVYFLPSDLNYGWVCGRDARVIRTTDRGKTWRGITLPSTEHLESIHFTTKNIGYVSGVDGIWKSVDGGSNWINITPSDTVSYWGCYFSDSNNGVLVGDGCLLDHQYFWHTSDGGNTWTQFIGNQENSGLTDAIIVNPNTEAYAISSGRLWISYDGGSTWDVKDTTGTTVWHEELCKFANSFLIPTSGSTCSGGGGVGGMRFSTNGGSSWTDRPSPRGPMYGTFMINQASGWACGLYGQVLYTDDAGQSWEEKSCGLDESHLDDIRFLTADEGWVVGQGLYHLAKSTYGISEDPVVFRDMCLPGYIDKTIYISNKSFNSSMADLDIRGINKDDFTLMLPNTSFNMASCEDYPVTIRFEPSSLGQKNAILHCEFTGAITRDIPLQGFALEPSLLMDSTTLVINPAYCGMENTSYLGLGSLTKKDTIDSYQKKNGSLEINFLSSFPMGVVMGSTISVVATPKDTGWIETQYLLKLMPCENDTVMTIRAYGVSPIINAPLQRQQVLACISSGEMLIPVSNTGNADLYLPNLEFVYDNPNFKYKGTKSKKSFPLTIAPEASDTLIIELQPVDFGIHKETLYIYNNDSTKARGEKNPYIVELQYEYSTPLPEVSDMEIDFGKLCMGENLTKNFKFYNKGSIEFTLSKILSGQAIFDFDSDKYSNQTIHPADSLEIDLDFTATEIGKISDTLMLLTNPCADTIYVQLIAKVEDAALRATPDDIVLNVQTGETVNESLNLKSYSTVDLNIISVKLVPDNPNLDLQFTDAFPLELKSGKSLDLAYSIIASKDLSYSGSLCIETDGFCDADTCVPFAIESFSGKIELSANSLNFGYYICTPEKIEKSIKISNSSDYSDTLTKLELVPSGVFLIKNMPTLPLYLQAGESVDLDIEFDIQAEGTFEAELLVSSYLMQNREIKVPMKIEYRTPITTVDIISNDFGTKEKCDETLAVDFTISNSGTIADTLKYSELSVSGFSNSLNNNLILDAGKDTTITITFVPEETSGLGAKSYSISLNSLVCGNEFTYTSSATIIAPRVSFAPTSINLGKVWKDYSKDTLIVIHNNSQVDREIRKIEFQPQINGMEYIFDVPKTISAGESDTIFIHFLAQEKGEYNTKLFVEDYSVCVDSSYMDISVTVPDEYYKVDLRVGNYLYDIYDEAIIEVFLENPVPRFNPSSISLSINYDTKLFNPEKSYLHLNGEKTEINLIRSANSLIINTNGANIDSLLAQEGIIFTIEGSPLASVPQVTELQISDITIDIQKPYDFSTEDGLLQVQGYCEPMMHGGLVVLPNMSAEVTNSINADYINIKMKSDKPQYADISIFDLSGCETKTKIFVDNEASYMLSTETLSQGVYFITLKTEWGKQIANVKILILK